MADLEQDQLVSEVAREIIREIAPEELPLFRAQSRAYFANPAAALKGEPSKDDMLGFGAGEVVVFLTPIALQIVTQVVAALTEELKKTAKQESPKLVGAILRLILQGKNPSDGPAPSPVQLTPAQLQRVRDAALAEAKRCRVSEDRANLLADAIAGRLAIAGS